MAEPHASEGGTNGSVSALREHDRRSLLGAVVEPFVSEGYRAATAEGICRASGIDRELFGHLFTGTEDCFLQALDLIVSEAREEIAAAIPARAGWPDQLAISVRMALELIDANPGPSRLVLVQAPRASNPIARHYFDLIQSLSPFFAEGRRYADRPLPDILDTTLAAGAASMLGAHLGKGRTAPVSTLFGELLRYLAMPYVDEEQIADLASSHRPAHPGRIVPLLPQLPPHPPAA